MPIEFEKCRANGGKIRTKSLPGGKYIHICIPSGGGKGSSIAGEVKTKQKINIAKYHATRGKG